MVGWLPGETSLPTPLIHAPRHRRQSADLADNAEVYFTTPHSRGYPAILVQLDRIGMAELEELLLEAWLSRAPKRLAKDYLDASE